jgi:adenylyl cyclase-associated protein
MSLDSAVTNLLKRLETVTARLEQVEKQIASGAGSAPAAATASGSSDDGTVSASVTDYDALIDEFIVPLGPLTAELGNNELKSQVAKLEAAIRAQRQFIFVASKSKKPDVAGFQKLLEPTNKALQDVVAIREKAGKVNAQFNHLSALSEGVGALGWVAAPPTPGPFVNEARASSEFYSNKILMEFKKTNEKQVEWVQKWNGFLKELAVYIKKHHTTDVTWNARGGDATAAAAGGPPPPPASGPPPPPAGAPAPAKSGAPSADPNALFAALNKGADITSGLKKVTKEMKNKNQTDKPAAIVPAAASAPKKAAAKPTTVKKGTPVYELQGNKWVIEWQENNQSIHITETEPRHTVYIYKCENTVVKVDGKINNVTLDGCKKVGVIFDQAISACEVVNSNSIEIQVLHKVPSVAIDKCTGVQVFLSKDALDTEIVSSKSDSMNVLIPDPAGGLDPIEIAIPEQFKTTVVNNKLNTQSVEHC